MVKFYQRKQQLEKLPKTSISADDISVLLSAKDYLNQLLAHIDNATKRIYMTVLYLENDQAGQLVVEHLIAAKKRQPALEIKVFVDFHRARRGLIGHKESEGNAAYYQEIDQKYPDFIKFYGVAIKQREVFGVLHLKGIIIDDVVLYTGASINNIYLHHQDRYRYDRYCTIASPALSNSFVEYLDHALIPSEGVYQFNRYPLTPDSKFKKHVAAQRKQLSRTHYKLPQVSTADLTITPLIGLGKRTNQLNNVIHRQLRQCKDDLVLYTPYFNLPGILKRDITRLLRRGVKVEIVVGDKHASDFFIPEDQPFSKIGLIPYLYETMLKAFAKRHQKSIDNGQLIIRLWRHQQNSFHLKGVRVDNQYHLLTGNNLNPRAWRLDIENGLLIDDQQGDLLSMFNQEHQQIITYTQVITHWQEIESPSDYPETVRKWLTRFKRINLDKVFKQYM